MIASLPVKHRYFCSEWYDYTGSQVFDLIAPSGQEMSKEIQEEVKDLFILLSSEKSPNH